MISLLLLIFLVRSIGMLAREKGESTLKWKIRTICAWIVGDLTGELIVFYFFGFDIILLCLFAPGLAYIGYLIIRQWLDAIDEA